MSAERGDARRLLLLGFLTLFVELALIRYLPAVIWNLGYFPNLVLVAVFVGMGIGFGAHQLVDARRSARLFLASPFCLLGLLVVADVTGPALPGFSTREGQVGGELYFTHVPERVTQPSVWPFVLLFGLVVLFNVLVSQRTAKLFARFTPLRAYTLDIGGSCCGILCFTLMSWAQLPAVAWFLAALPLFVLAAEPQGFARRVLVALPVLGCVVLVYAQDRILTFNSTYRGPLEVTWSPYQKIEYMFAANTPTIMVNGIPHQHMFGIEYLDAEIYGDVYRLRAQHPELSPIRNVLVIGAGSGNDVAVALHHGVAHVDAVEIDPVIHRLGHEHHPARPYADPRVHAHIDDGRAFMRRTDRKYDLVVFALTDSLVKVSAMAQLRLENYIYTVESIRKAYELLAPDGYLLFYNVYRRDWLVLKMGAMIEAATGRQPRLLREGASFSGLVLESSELPPPTDRARFAGLSLATDDWPFFYLSERAIGGVYLGAIGGLVFLLVLVMTLLQRASRSEPGMARARRLARELGFMLMGVAFLLLETKSVIQFSLLFGTTWLNASLVFIAVLVLVLLANWTAVVVRGMPLLAVFMLLVASTLVPLVFPLAELLDVQGGVMRFVLAGLVTFVPVFFANLLFSLSFRDQPEAEHLFGWNLLGATLGGALEYTSMVIGYGALALVVAGCYVAAFGLLHAARREGRARPAERGSSAA